jgi:hypothetical protein
MTMSAGSSDRQTLRGVRRVLAWLLFAGLVGTFVELLLLEHDESALQVMPLGLLGASAAAMIATTLRPRALVVIVFRSLMVLLIATGALGLILHYRANLEFQRDLTPALGTMELFWKVMAAKAPPALAPAVLTQLGLLGLVYGYTLPARSDGIDTGVRDVEVR